MNTQSSAQPAVPHATRLDARREIVWGFVVIGLFFGGILAWSLLAPLSSAAIAPGVVTVDGNRKTVQHLEGGIVEEILVRDGDRVAAGQALVRLRPLVAETEYRQLETRRALLLGQEARLRAEQAGDDRIEFPGSLHLAADSDPDIGEALADQQVIFDTRRAGLLGQLQAMDEEIDEATRELDNLNAKADALGEQRRLIRRETNEFRAMARDGLVPRTQLFTRERMLPEIDAEISSNAASIAAVGQRISQLTSRRQKLLSDRAAETAERLGEIREELVDIDFRLGRARDALNRTVVRAPVGGIVINRRVNTPGGVLRQGDPLMDIVPATAELVVEARVDPRDRDQVERGMHAEMRFTAFNQRSHQPVPGKVVDISADAIHATPDAAEAQTSYYRARVSLPSDTARYLDGVAPQPGMQVDVMIVMGERTVIDYVLSPLFRSFNRAMREE